MAHDLKLVIDSREFAYRRDQGWNDYFLPFCPDLFSQPDIPIDIDCHSNIRGPGTEFNVLREYEPGSILIGGGYIRGFEKILGAMFAMIFRLSDEAARQVARIENACALPASYASIHIRRGDKVGDEDEYYPVELYLDRLDAQGVADLPIFVLSDDHQSVVQIEAALRSRQSSAVVSSLCEERYRGFSIDALRQEQPVFSKADTSASISSAGFREDIGTETIRLLAETVIASRSECFIGTFRSNVGRSIRYLHDRWHRCVLLTPDELAAAANDRSQRRH